jgi:L-rhamnose mutarotase
MSKYKGMTCYGVTTKDIKEYASEHNLNPTDVWKKVIDKFVKNGATEYAGYTENCVDYYAKYWKRYRYCYVTSQNVTFHYDSGRGTTIISVSVKELLEENEDDWYTNGKLPPVGTECIVNWFSPMPEEMVMHQAANGRVVKIVSHDMTCSGTPVAVFKVNSGAAYLYHSLTADCFMPIPKEKTELELLTEKCTEILSGELSSKDIGIVASKLYDGGVRVMESNKDA